MPDLPDYLDKDVLPQPEALDAALAALQQRTAAPVFDIVFDTVSDALALIHRALAMRDYGDKPGIWEQVWTDVANAAEQLRAALALRGPSASIGEAMNTTEIAEIEDAITTITNLLMDCEAKHPARIEWERVRGWIRFVMQNKSEAAIRTGIPDPPARSV